MLLVKTIRFFCKSNIKGIARRMIYQKTFSKKIPLHSLVLTILWFSKVLLWPNSTMRFVRKQRLLDSARLGKSLRSTAVFIRDHTDTSKISLACHDLISFIGITGFVFFWAFSCSNWHKAICQIMRYPIRTNLIYN